MRPYITLLEFVRKSLFDERNGYYSVGKVRFGEDFSTLAFSYAPVLANRFFLMWQSMIQFKEITKDETFYLYEFGAGNGQAAERILDYVYGRSLKEAESEWPDFYRAIHYIIGEISPALIERQKNNLRYYIDKGKAQV